MTQYLMSVVSDPDGRPTPEETKQSWADTGKFNDKLQETGVWVFAGGLHEISTSTVVDNRGDNVVTTDGPYSESKEYLAGFWIVEVPDLDAALALAAEGSKACRARVEVRPFQSIEEAARDLGVDVP
ncbi:YciI family protein [Luteipulveratus mongoliensis]|uniref:DGPFAETKE family protein n=1 Tax=Luteipulveratus mongoliensis TaxID=571913 RepID=A0A0K1JD68_9MICO|nr:YciI family protein [Luteipulveratus mongoliensis]AKU14644.1 DGPFAETKE family protein [Luteipulveratus mongoliensis]